MSVRSNRLAQAFAALGLVIAGSVMVAPQAEASPLNGGWGHHGIGANGHCRPIRLCNPGYPRWGGGYGAGHGGRWGGGVVIVDHGFPPAERCRLVQRVNHWGEIVVRRVCRPARWH